MSNKNKKIEVWIYEGYTGAPKIEVEIDGQRAIIEHDHLEEIIINAMNTHGWNAGKTGRQQVPRLRISF